MQKNLPVIFAFFIYPHFYLRNLLTHTLSGMASKRRLEERENHDRWLVSYSDFLTLLLALFVVMYAISQVNEGKYKVVAGSLVTAFGNQPNQLNRQPITTATPGS